MYKLLRYAFNSLYIKISISAVILYLIFSNLSIRKILDSLGNADLKYLIPGLLIISVTRALPAFGTRALLNFQGVNVNILSIVQINLTSAFYGLFLPGFLSGGPVKLYKIRKIDNRTSEILTSLVFERLIDTVVLILMGLIFFLPYIYADLFHINFVLFILISSLLIMILSFFFLINDTAHAMLYKIIIKLNSYIDSEKLIQFQDSLIKSIKQFKSISTSLFFYIAVISFIKHLLGVVCFYLFAISVNINITFIEFGWIRSVLLIAISLPISLSGLGIREGVLIYLLNGFGIQPENTVAFSLILFIRLLFVGIIGGIFEFKEYYCSTSDSTEAV